MRKILTAIAVAITVLVTATAVGATEAPAPPEPTVTPAAVGPRPIDQDLARAVQRLAACITAEAAATPVVDDPAQAEIARLNAQIAHLNQQINRFRAKGGHRHH